MIERLTVRNFILVENLEIEFGERFNALTGETGAGKSILVGALSVLFGAKGGVDLVRGGAEEAYVAGEFRVAGHTACLAWLDERHIEPDDGVILVRRTIRATGRGTIYMQSTPVTRADLEQFSSFLLDLHSQHEHQSLFVETNHRRILDRYAGIESDVSEFSALFGRFSEMQRRLAELDQRESDRVREIEMVRFALAEIEDVAPQPGELESLEAERHRMNEFERLAESLEATIQLLDGTEYAALPVLKRIRHEIGVVARIDGELDGEAKRLENTYFEVEDIAQTLSSYRDRLNYDPARLDEIEERLASLRKLFRKYGDTIQAVDAYRESSQRSLEELEGAEESREALRAERVAAEQEIARRARDIHARRDEAAEKLQREISDVLAGLAMGQASFVVDIETHVNDAGRLVCGPEGADKVRFLIAANPGEEPRPLSRIASGGEISRVMLAIKTIVAAVDEVRSLVFDEIDTGIGGKVALAIASHLHDLSRHGQIICITHLATIAVRADNHIVVEKVADDTRTRIGVRELTGEDRVREISRMLAGDVEESHSVGHARALLERYHGRAHGQD